MIAIQSAAAFGAAALPFALIARTRTRACGRSLSFSRPSAVAFGAAGLLTSICVAHSNFSDTALLAAITASYVVISAITDLQTGLVFDAVAIACGLTIGLLSIMDGRVVTMLNGAAVMGGSLLILYGLTRGRGIGFGDVKLAAVLGGALGALGGLAVLGGAFVLGTVTVLPAIAWGWTTRRDAVAFAPYLAAATLIALCIGGVPS